MIYRNRRQAVWAWFALATLIGCTTMEFGTAVVGGEPAVRPIIDAGDVPDMQSMDADAVVDMDVEIAVKDIAIDLPNGCRSNVECTDAMFPVCDVPNGRCVQCTPTDDRCPRGRFCNPTTAACSDGCRNDDDCVLPSNNDGGTTATRRYCDVARRVCVQCRRDVECPTGQFCAGNECATMCSASRPCPTGFTCCGAACVNTQENSANCGSCGTACSLPGAVPICRDATCIVGTCNEPFGDCDGRAATGCETDLRTTTNCGACDRACPVRPNASATCDPMSRVCGFTCNSGYADCNRRPEDGCEAQVSADVSNCGMCGNACNLANATAACQMGRCAVGVCNPGFADCDGDASNGCEVDTRTSTRHCGACGRTCSARTNTTAACVASACRNTCIVGFADCNGRMDDGCEVDTTRDQVNCGGCGVLCRPPNAMGACSGGACTIMACAPNFQNCNGRLDDGCEIDVRTANSHCGMCGRTCSPGQFCQGGSCMLDCGILTRCGMSCADLQSDNSNCGACGRACAAGQDCVAGTCRVVCRAPQVECSGACVVTSTDVRHCGRCGNVCAARPNSTATCSTGTCGFACTSGFGDCDGDPTNGCEVNLTNSPSHCGACGARCSLPGATSTCEGSACGLGVCNPGLGDCDGIAGNGCEATLATDSRNCGRCGNACASTCAAGVCAPVVVIDRPTVIDTLAAQVEALAGTRSAMLIDAAGMTIPVGTRVIFHQTQGAASVAGNFEFNRVVASSGVSLMLETPLANTYSTRGTARAQIVAVAQYDDLIVGATGELTAPEWNGRTGGILALEARGAVNVQGVITMNGRGFRGNTRVCSAVPFANNCRVGVQGESWPGFGTASSLPNGGGGGGGGQGQDCGAGGGAAYGTGATNGSPGDCNSDPMGECAPRCPNDPGLAGSAYGATSPSGVLHLGSAGGEGGLDEDGGLPGVGGSGGGIIFLRITGSLTVTGSIRSNGVDGLIGAQFACGGRGCGMGGGGGGSGGAIRLTAARAVLGAGLISSTGGIGAQCTCRTTNIRRALPAGNGGVGRVFVSSPSAVGTTVPMFDPS
jgi:hypothetical protein